MHNWTPFCLDQRATVPLLRQSTKPNWIQAPDKSTAQSQPCSVTSVHCWVRDWLDGQLQRSFHRAWKTFPGSELDRSATSVSPSKALCSTSRQAAGPTLPRQTSHTIISQGDHLFCLKKTPSFMIQFHIAKTGKQRFFTDIKSRNRGGLTAPSITTMREFCSC